MRLNEVVFDGSVPVDGYGPGFFRLKGEVHEGALLLLPDGPARWDAYATAPILAAAAAIDVVLLGTGAEIAAAPDGFTEALEAAGIGVEVMATPSACRTYNVLLGEGRRIGAALIPV
ncbi:MAG: Mth938-like domain-containing protein [Rubricella sp.]